jgi:DNA-binding XRE family transcriptional regulator
MSKESTTCQTKREYLCALEETRRTFVPLRKLMFTQEQAATQFGVSRRHLQKFEKGDALDPYLCFAYRSWFSLITD